MDNDRDELKGRFTAWLEVVVKRAKIDYIRKLNRQPKSVSLDSISEDELGFNHTYKSSTESTESFEFDNEKVSQAFNALSFRHRTILTLMFVQRKTAEQVAAILGCSAKSVFNEKSIALKQLRESIGEIKMAGKEFELTLRRAIDGDHESLMRIIDLYEPLINNNSIDCIFIDQENEELLKTIGDLLKDMYRKKLL